MPNKLISTGFLLLAFLLSINNIITQVGLNVLHLPEMFVLWKECIVVVLMGLMIWHSRKVNVFTWYPIWIFGAMLGLGFFSSFSQQVAIRELFLGFRVELLWVGLLATTLVWVRTNNENELTLLGKNLTRTVLYGYALVAIITALSLVFGQVQFFGSLGFSNGWDSTNQTILQSPLCHSIDAAGGGCRLSGGFSNPNNFAGYLLMILPVLIVSFVGCIQRKNWKMSVIFGLFIVSNIVFIIWSFARFSWVALGITIIAFGSFMVYKKYTGWFWKWKFYGILLLPLLALLAFLSISSPVSTLSFLPSSITKPNSTLAHYNLTKVAWESAFRKGPTLILQGYGLGQTGPIAKPQYKEIINSKFGRENADLALKYDVRPWELSIPENWYLQVILNGGWVYFALFMSILAFTMRPLWNLGKTNWEQTLLLLGIVAICIGNLVLHIWENPTISYYMAIIYILSVTVQRESIVD
jgi:hypothetical protein